MTAAITIHDLDVSKDLDKTAMSHILGGFSHGYGSYDHFDQGSWKLIYSNSFRTRLAKGGKLYHAIQYQYSWKRTQYWYRGRVRYGRQVT